MENEIAGCLQDYRGILATMYVNDKYKERKAAETKANTIKVLCIINILSGHSLFRPLDDKIAIAVKKDIPRLSRKPVCFSIS